MKRVVFLVLLALLVKLDVLAQNKQWTLRECEDHAISNNISIKQSEVARVKQTYTLSTARNKRLPDLSATLGENLSFGRGLTADNIICSGLRICGTKSRAFTIGPATSCGKNDTKKA